MQRRQLILGAATLLAAGCASAPSPLPGGSVVEADAATAIRAMEAARRGFPAWSATPAATAC